MKTLQLKAFGKPTTAPELIESDPPKPAPGQVLVALEAAPINPSDLLLIQRSLWASSGTARRSRHRGRRANLNLHHKFL